LGAQGATTADVVLLLGNGDGTFQAPVTTVTATAGGVFTTFIGGAVSIQSTDFNGDGHPDLVVVNNLDTHTHIGTRFVTDFTTATPGAVVVLMGNGDGTFQAPQSFGAGVSPNAVAAGDFNGDGHPDFAVSNRYNPLLALFSNTGGGNFSGSTISLGSNN